MEIRLPNKWSPRPYQRRLWEYLGDGGKRAVAVWHRRCLAVGTMVTMADGSWKPIEEVQAGDEILAWSDGRYLTDSVNASWYAGLKPVVKVSCSGLPSVVCTPDHRFWIHHQGYNGRWQSIGSIVKKGKFGSVDQVAAYSVMEWDRDGDDVALAELCGYLITDGSVNAEQSPKYTTTTPALLERVSELCDLVGAVPRIREKGRGWDLHLANGTRGGGEIHNPVKEVFRSEGALAKREFRRIPRSLWRANRESIAKFFGAVIDGDGSLFLSPSRTAFDGKPISAAAEVKIHVGESSNLAWDYYWLLRKIGVVASQVTYVKNSCWTIRIWTREAVITLLKLVTFKHPDKESRRIEILSTIEATKPRLKYGELYTASASIDEEGFEDVWDIETENHSCFFANGYLVHNSGKDEVCMHHTAWAAFHRVGNYWHMLPEANQTRKAIWTAVNSHAGLLRIDMAFPVALRRATNKQDMHIDFANQSSWQCVGSDNFNSLIGASPVGIVWSEWAVADPASWAYLSPILEENDGWAVFVYTPRSENHGLTLYESAKDDPRWFCEKLTVDDTGLFSQTQLNQIQKELAGVHGTTLGDAIFQQEYYVSFAAPVLGAIYAKEMEKAEQDGRIREVPHDSALPVYTAWDLGMSDATAIWWFQVAMDGIRIIDWYENSQQDLAHYAGVVLGRHCEVSTDGSMVIRPGVIDIKHRHRIGYQYGGHYLPPDAEQKLLAAGGKSIAHQLRSVLQSVQVAKVPNDLDQCIAATRASFPRFIFDRDRTLEGRRRVRQYRYEYNERHHSLSAKPVHDWTSHSATALHVVALSWRPYVEAARVTPAPKRRSWKVA